MNSQASVYGQLRGPKLQELIIEGDLTKVVLELGYFEVVSRYRVYISPFHKLSFFPHRGNFVYIKDLEAFEGITNTAVVGVNTTLNRVEQHPQQENLACFYSYFVEKDFYRNADNVIMMDSYIRIAEYLGVGTPAVQAFVKELLSLIQNNNYKIVQIPPKIKLPKDITRVSHHRRLYLEGPLENNHAFNVYPSKVSGERQPQAEYLCGILVISHYHGRFLLYDPKIYIHVKFFAGARNLSRFHDALVIIKKHVLVTEIFKDELAVPLEYILVHERDVRIVWSGVTNRRKLPFYPETDSVPTEFKYTFYLYISKKSEVIFGYQGSPELYLETLISENSRFSAATRFYVVLPEELLQLSVVLREQVTYRVYTNTRLERTEIASYKELFALRDIKTLLKLSPDAVFQETSLPTRLLDASPHNEVLSEFSEAKDRICNSPNYGTLSFELVILKKTMQSKKFPSFYPTRHENIPYFGDVGNFQQTIVFREKNANSEGPSTQFIDVYWVNRENHLMPLGLVNGAVVRLHRVQVNKGKYVKSSVFTTVEVVGFKPSFSSANFVHHEGFLDFDVNDSLTFLGDLPKIPVDCVVAGTVFFLSILEIGVKVYCVHCKRAISKYNVCSCPTKHEVKATMMIQVKDGYNKPFMAEISDINFLLDLLGFHSQLARAEFLEECFEWKNSTMNFQKFPEEILKEMNKSDDLFDKVMWLLYHCVNYKMKTPLNLLCIRQIGKGLKPYKVLSYKFAFVDD